MSQFTPRPYQLEAVKWLTEDAHGKGIIADEMGLGKTGEIFLAWKAVGFPKPCIILAGVNAQIAWLTQAASWGCPPPTRIRGTAIQREKLWKQHGLDFVTTTREALKADIKANRVDPSLFKCVIVDEVHKDSNRK